MDILRSLITQHVKWRYCGISRSTINRNEFGYLYKPLKKGNSLQQNETISCAVGLRIALLTVARSAKPPRSEAIAN